MITRASHGTVFEGHGRMKCYIYRCSRKQDLYIYLSVKDDFSCVPSEIMGALGATEFTMELELTPDRKLARENATSVRKNLSEKGFHLQLPGSESVEAMMARIATRNH